MLAVLFKEAGCLNSFFVVVFPYLVLIPKSQYCQILPFLAQNIKTY